MKLIDKFIRYLIGQDRFPQLLQDRDEHPAIHRQDLMYLKFFFRFSFVKNYNFFTSFLSDVCIGMLAIITGEK